MTLALKDFKYLIKNVPRAKKILDEEGFANSWHGLLLKSIANGKTTKEACEEYRQYFLANILPKYREPAYSNDIERYKHPFKTEEVQELIKHSLQQFNRRYREAKTIEYHERYFSYTPIQGPKLDRLELPSRIENALTRACIISIEQLLEYSYNDILEIRGIGELGANQILTKLQEQGLAK